MRPSGFEWDQNKAKANLVKHGVSFHEATRIWLDPNYYRVKVAHEPEDRWLVVGRVARGRYLSAIVTYRGVNPERTRIISARRATKTEVRRYHG